MELITNEDCEEAAITLEMLLDNFLFILKNNPPSLNGKRLLTGENVQKILNVSKRTLQEYRDTRKIPYIPLFGKYLYLESDLLELLEENYIARLK